MLPPVKTVTRHSPERIAEIIELRRRGIEFKAIAAKFGMTKNAVIGVMNRHVYRKQK